MLRPVPAAIATATLGVVAALTATAAAAAINSNLYIEPAKTFVLGGGQPGAFTVSGENKGAVAVEILAQEDGSATFIARVAPGERFEQDFARGEAALLRNSSEREQAHVKVRVTGYTRSLGMRYEGR